MSSSSSCFCHSPVALLKIIVKPSPQCNIGISNRGLSSSLRSHGPNLLGLRVPQFRAGLDRDWSFIGGSRVTIVRPQLANANLCPKGLRVSASWLAGSQLANNVFTLGTVAVLPFYTLMVLAPKAELTKRSIQSGTPYVILGLLYAYLLYLSWTPDTVHYIFASKYLLPELTGIAKMFSNEMTLASAWIHLLAVDLFAARQVYYDGLENEIETRHSVSLCLFFCPIGIVSHVVTKALTQIPGNSTKKHGM